MNSKTIIIAEAGVNHNGSIERAFQLIDAAVDAGVDLVKFQTFTAEKLVTKTALKADYQIENTKDGRESQFEMLKKIELSINDHELLIKYCTKKNIGFFSTAFDLDSLQFLCDLGLDLVKIPSGELTNLPYLRLAAKLFSKVIISSGMANMEEIKDAVDVFLEQGFNLDNIIILHCNTEYPTPMQDVNLMAMLEIKERFGTQVGYSDHTLGIEVPIASVALGAKVIEKHFTLDRNLPGPDHLASLEPIELKNMVSAIRNIELALAGNGIKQASESELKNIVIARKSIHTNKKLIKGQLLTDDDLIALRPGDGISPMNWDKIIGKKLRVDKNEFEKLLHSDLE